MNSSLSTPRPHRERSHTITIALAGNPNSGKTSVFNYMTGVHQHVGNYPGVTVEKREGICHYRGHRIRVIDLPGTYSLTAYSQEEVVARNVILDGTADVVVDIVDASNLERNLYLTTQIMELGVPLVLAFNMSDVAKSRGFSFDLDTLSSLFNAKIVLTVGHRGEGIDALLDAVLETFKQQTAQGPADISYGKEIEEELSKLQRLVERDVPLNGHHARWIALKLLENDCEIYAAIQSQDVLNTLHKSSSHLQKVFGDNPEIVIADRRYGFISGACQESVRSTVESRHSWSDRIDAVIVNPIVGIPIFLLMMYIIFFMTFTLAEPFVHGLEWALTQTAGFVGGLWPAASDSPLRSLLVDGIINGVGMVIVFLPNLVFLFMAIALLEDTGYMARAAFIMDRVMHHMGLHGKSFVPMVIGFGCSVPAIMATRTLENRRDRLTTMLVVPLMSCGARFPIYALIIPAFFAPRWHAPMLWLLYLIGIALAVISARLIRSVLLRGESTPFVMELPPYRMPTLRGVLIHTWERSKLYVSKAGTIILGIAIVLWAMASYPQKKEFERDYDAERTAIQEAYVVAGNELNPMLGLPSHATLIMEAIQAELDYESAQNRLRPTESAYAEAHVALDAQLTTLRGMPDGPVLDEFLDVRDRVNDIYAQFDEDVNAHGYEPSSVEYALLEQKRDVALSLIKTQHPEAFAAVNTFRERIRQPYENQIEQLAADEQAERLSYSIAGRVGSAIEPVLKPLGFDWRIATALIGAFAAKEVFVTQLAVVYAVGNTDDQTTRLRTRLREQYPPLVAFTMMLFCLIGLPCVATFAATRAESHSWRWAIFQFTGLTVLAYFVTLVVFQIGQLAGIGMK